MLISRSISEIFVPDSVPLNEAFKRTTHMGISAHQDDLEIMAIEGILACYRKQSEWFTGVIVTDGAGSARRGIYADYTDEAMKIVRKDEQRKAAYLGEYSAVAFMDLPSSVVKSPDETSVEDGLADLIANAQPKIIYTHNLADKHDTHVAVALRVINAVRKLSDSEKPEKLYGCEVWRDLDWMVDSEKVKMEINDHESLASALVALYDSQISGGKRYDLATIGRRQANATYSLSHETDKASQLIYAMDLTPLIHDASLKPLDYALERIRAFEDDVANRIRNMGG